MLKCSTLQHWYHRIKLVQTSIFCSQLYLFIFVSSLICILIRLQVQGVVALTHRCANKGSCSRWCQITGAGQASAPLVWVTELDLLIVSVLLVPFGAFLFELFDKLNGLVWSTDHSRGLCFSFNEWNSSISLVYSLQVCPFSLRDSEILSGLS